MPDFDFNKSLDNVEKAPPSIFFKLGRDLFPNKMIRCETRYGREGFVFDVRLPFYTSFSLSSITEITVEVNGKAYDSKDVFFIMREMVFPAEFVKTVHELLFHMGETAEIFVAAPLCGKKTVSLNLKFGVRPSFEGYMLSGNNTIVYDRTQEMEVC